MVSLGLATVGLGVGAGLWLGGLPRAGELVWLAVTAGGVVAGSWWVLDAARHRRLGADVVAVVAMCGTVAVGEPLAGAIVAVMLFSGRSLEAFANARAHRELGLLTARTPRVAHRRQGPTRVDVPVEEVRPGDELVVATGEVVPVDGLVAGEPATVDESALTGEPLPVVRSSGEPVPMSPRRWAP